MKRWHLVELEDLSWVPRVVRDGGRDVLDWMFRTLGMYRPVVERLRATIAASGATQVVDLCSGGGGGAVHTFPELGGAVDVVLTDRFPSESAAERVEARGDARLRYHREPVDAFAVPAELSGVRTMYSALHHFRPEEVKRLLAGVVATGRPLAFFDVAANPGLRRLPGFLVPLAMIPNAIILLLLTPLMVPWVRPLRASRLFFTYVLPLIPILYAWDGTVSGVRAYAPDEVLALAREVPGSERYTWECGRAGSGPRAVLYLTGVAKS